MLKPELMIPWYRYGQQTPWGGNAFRQLYGRSIPDEHTGESLEVSVVPGMNSRLTDGTELSEYLALHGEAAMGRGCQSLPLLLKLIDAQDTLSVQVHPNDEFARQTEGKSGKTEAWYILSAREGAFLVYGLQGIRSKEMLKHSAMDGTIEQHLRKIPVHAGETYYIPAGTVHAIGEGLLIYEIQQSSDITYRFFDWNRLDQNGNARPLHIDRATEAADLSFSGVQASAVTLAPTRDLLLRKRFFSLEKWHDCKAESLVTDGTCFYIMTALSDTVLTWQDAGLRLGSGDTAFIPALCFPLRIDSDGLLMAYPTSEDSYDR